MFLSTIMLPSFLFFFFFRGPALLHTVQKFGASTQPNNAIRQHSKNTLRPWSSETFIRDYEIGLRKLSRSLCLWIYIRHTLCASRKRTAEISALMQNAHAISRISNIRRFYLAFRERRSSSISVSTHLYIFFFFLFKLIKIIEC